MYSINNDKVYEVIDGLKETAKLDEEVAAATERLTEKILDEVDAFTALEYTQDPQKIRKITEALAGAEVDGISVGEILTSDDYDLKGDPILYPAEEDIPKTEIFENLDYETQQYMAMLWNELKIEGNSNLDAYIGLSTSLVLVVIYLIYKFAKKKKREKYY